ncbi:UNVERIFIED_CONTAM: hypothetical protein FKN15_030675 [Acipenser sinensis]
MDRKGLNTQIKKDVYLLTTIHNEATVAVPVRSRDMGTNKPDDCEKVQRTIKRGAIEELDKPLVICDYTSKMGAVDRADHYCASYAFTRVVEEYVLLAAGSSNCEQ